MPSVVGVPYSRSDRSHRDGYRGLLRRGGVELNTRSLTQDGIRFEFGRNWAGFLELVDESRVADAVHSLQQGFGSAGLSGSRLLDLGCGSGLFSLAARRLGAKVVSFDLDPRCVACAESLKRRFLPDDPDWVICTGSVLDEDFLVTLGRFDAVYAWGVLHHTGDMWRALRLVERLLFDNGTIWISLYNDQARISTLWRFIKRAYVRHPAVRPLLIAAVGVSRILPSIAVRRLFRRPYPRGMSPWHDLIDWLGGYPFETARPDDVVNHYLRLGYRLHWLRTVGGASGCNEFVFVKAGANAVVMA